MMLVAASGLLGLGVAAPAHAADLGGNCCADLEQRVAELEATTARKGNRRVSLEVSGQVNRALLAWDDGFDSDAYIVDNSHSSSRFRFRGSGTIKEGWRAGFIIEIETRDSASNTLNQFSDDIIDDGTVGNLRIRQAHWYVESDRLGRISIGQQNSATKDLPLINLGGSLSDADIYFNTSFCLRSKQGAFLGREDVSGAASSCAAVSGSGFVWGNLANALDGIRGDFVRYDTPSIYGFILSAAWGENDYWDIALRYQQEWNSVRIAAGIGYRWDGDRGNFVVDDFGFRQRGGGNFEDVVGAVSVQHIPTGLYASFAAGKRDASTFTGITAATGDAFVTRPGFDADYFYAQLGITKRVLPYGATTFYSEFGRYNDFGTNLIAFASPGFGPDFFVTGSKVDRWSFGVVQAFDAAALEIYAQFHYYEADLDGFYLDAYDYRYKDKLQVEDWFGGVLGARIRF
jgi:hypothetical protein